MLDIPVVQQQLDVMRRAARGEGRDLPAQWKRSKAFGEALAAVIEAGAFSDAAYTPIMAQVREGIRIRDYEGAVIAPLGHFLFGRRANSRQQLAAIIAAVEQQLVAAQQAGHAPAAVPTSSAAKRDAGQVHSAGKPAPRRASATAGQPRRPRARVGWQAARDEAERLVAEGGGYWPGVNELARQVRCGKGTMIKVIRSSPYLQAAQGGEAGAADGLAGGASGAEAVTAGSNIAG